MASGCIIVYPCGSWSFVTLKHYNLFLLLVHLSVGEIDPLSISYCRIVHLQSKAVQILEGNKRSDHHQSLFPPKGNREQYTVSGQCSQSSRPKNILWLGIQVTPAKVTGSLDQISSPTYPSILRHFKQKDSCITNMGT